MENQPGVVAIVLNWNGAEDTIECVRSLRLSDYGNLKIVVVDNASTDESVKVIRNSLPGICLIEREMNGGYGAGNNTGIVQALDQNADFVLIVNNDVVVTEGTISELVKTALSDERIGVVTCTVRYKDRPERIYYAGGELNRWLCTGVNVPRRFAQYHRGDPISNVSFVNGCLMLIRASVFSRMGMFDNAFFMYFEDLEFSRRVGKEFRLCYTPSGVAMHRSGGGTGWQNYSELYLYYYTRNRALAFRDESSLYRAYVLAFQVVNAMAKSIVLLLNLRNTPRKGSGQVRSLWKGVVAGVRGKEGKL